VQGRTSHEATLQLADAGVGVDGVDHLQRVHS
jgi:hypothetical protein